MALKLPVMNAKLAQRIEQSEIDYLTSRISSIGEREGNPTGVEIKKFGHSTTVFYIRDMPWRLFNSVVGLSYQDMDYLGDITKFYQERERTFQIDINPAGCNPKLLRCLAEHGLFQDSFHSVMYALPSEQLPPLPAEISIREIANEADFDLYAEIHCVGSGMSAIHKHHFVNNNIGLLNRPGWRLFLACWNDIPAAVAVMHISGNIASCTLAATAPEFRRKGLQTALLHRRLDEAHRANCELVVAQASFTSTSHNNMERVGMRIAWTRSVWVPL